MPNSIKSFTDRRLKQVQLDEFFQKELSVAEYGHMIFQPSSTATRITLKVGRVGLAIGRRGKTIKFLSDSVKAMLGEDNVQIEVEPLEDPEVYASVMAQRLASSLERGRHFRRSAYGTMRRIMATGALGCQITVAGKITSQRARVENFREGFVAKTGQPAEIFVQHGKAEAKIKRGILGVQVLIMMPGSVLPDDVKIIAEPTHTSKEIIKSDIGEDQEIALEDDEDLEEDFGELEEIEVEKDDIPADAMEALEEDELEDLEDDED